MIPTHIGPYNIDEKIGAGGMGSVYLGTHRETGEKAAIKVLPASLAHEEGFIERFNREIESMKKLQNPHIVRLFESGVDNETYYYSMEYVAGETLTHMIRRERRISWDRAVDIGIQICSALKAAHDAGIVHRDLKPSNLLVGQDGTIKLTDFGVAQVFAQDRLTVTGGIVGTAEYMSPEQAEGKRATKQSDLYSLGVVLYTLVCGRPPFAGKTAVDVMQKHKYGRFDQPRLVNPDVPSWLEEIIVQLLEKDPAKRFPDAFVVARRLEQVRNKMELLTDATAVNEGYGIREDDASVAVGATQRAGQGKSWKHGGPGPATLMKHLVRQELEGEEQPHIIWRIFNSTWFLAGALILVVGYIVTRTMGQELTPEQRFEQGVALMSHPEGSDWIKAREEFFLPLVTSDAETWKPQVEPFLSRIELYELKRQLKLSKARRTLELNREGGTTPDDDPDDKTDAFSAEPLRWLALAQELIKSGDDIRAEQIIRDVQHLLRTDVPEQQKLYDLCGKLLQDLLARRQQEGNRYGWLKGAQPLAVQFRDSGQPAEAAKVWRAVINLYQDDPAAQEFVEQARKGLQEIESQLPSKAVTQE